MASGYTRQAEANIAAGLTIQSADLNAEFNQIEAAFDGSTGHDHTGGSGLSPKISLTAAVSGILPAANGGTGSSSFTAGSVIFSNGTILTQDNASLFFDNTNNRLGIGTAAPATLLHVHNAVEARIGLTTSGTGASATDGLAIISGGSNISYVWNYENSPLVFATNNLERARIHASGNVSIGNTDDTHKLKVTGTGNITGNLTVGGDANITGAMSASGATIGSLSVSGAAALLSTLDVTGATTLNSLTLGTDLAIAQGGTGASTAASAFANIAVAASSIIADGYIKFQNGMILQWGTETFSGTTSKSVTFPLAFPSACFTLITSLNMAAGASTVTGWNNLTVSGFDITTSAAFNGTAAWFALGN